MLWERFADAVRAEAAAAGLDGSALAVAVYAEPTRTLPATRAVVLTAGAPWLESDHTFAGPLQRLRAVTVVPASTDDRLGTLYLLARLVLGACDRLDGGGVVTWSTVEQPTLATLPDGVEILTATVNLAGNDPAETEEQ